MNIWITAFCSKHIKTSFGGPTRVSCLHHQLTWQRQESRRGLKNWLDVFWALDQNKTGSSWADSLGFFSFWHNTSKSQLLCFPTSRIWSQIYYSDKWIRFRVKLGQAAWILHPETFSCWAVVPLVLWSGNCVKDHWNVSLSHESAFWVWVNNDKNFVSRDQIDNKHPKCRVPKR